MFTKMLDSHVDGLPLDIAKNFPIGPGSCGNTKKVSGNRSLFFALSLGLLGFGIDGRHLINVMPIF
jgi:hypothetical protein